MIPIGAGKLLAYARLLRLDKPVGILLLLWPTLWALWIAAEGRPDSLVFCVFVAGVVLMRSGGCAINDYADRDFDRHVARTRERPLARGELRPRDALLIFVLLSLLSFGLVLLLNRLTIQLAVVGAFLAASYPFLKRYTHLPQLYLGAAFGWGIPMAFAAQTGAVPAVAWWLFAANLLWAMAYDTFYAMVDRDDDLRIGVKSTAILFGKHDIAITLTLQLVVVGLLAVAGLLAGLRFWFGIGLLLATMTVFYQQYLIRRREPPACFRAFLNNVQFGWWVMVGIVLDYALV